ncbi:aspartate ammonia-lyase (plasmid) [Parasedimentitalea marina]|uniref:Aspartate ammonia-lyase n=1 Tax=Parasedimentitalea marina TaxID=2483033 RepID=A0A3T0N9R7_9RHOB|nr:aspartate ammonia-lyase [Parasedimentitalea marina]AZV80731.1 aspartate ammonia-lyase [Parasedimentitalea marina]
MTRIETDSLGQRELPDTALYGVNTLRGMENFDISPLTIGTEPAFVSALAAIKKAAAKANGEIGAISADHCAAIVAACDEIIAGKHHDQFVVDLLEGSGGTSINMNTNEVIANRALQILGYGAGQYDVLNPNDHINSGQSTNDVVPSAVKLAVLKKSDTLICALGHLAETLQAKAEEFAHVLKIGRTCMQAAQPMTLGQEFSGYAAALFRARDKVRDAVSDLLVLPLGGTAIGTGLGAQPGYRDAVYKHLAADLGKPVRPADNLFDGMQNADSFARVSSEFRIAAEVIGKISLDLIILSSGTKSGIGEIKLPSVQPGSSIMPGKVNPVLPMMMQQVAYAVVGNDASVSLASMGGQLEINHFEPVIAARMFDSMDLLTRGSRIFAGKCIAGIRALEDQALENLLGSSALATVFVPKLGYSRVSMIVKEAEAEGKLFVDAVTEMGLLSEDEIIRSLQEAAGQ